MVMKAVKYFLDILAKKQSEKPTVALVKANKIPNSTNATKAVSAVYRSESTGVIYTRPMCEFKDKFKKFDAGM